MVKNNALVVKLVDTNDLKPFNLLRAVRIWQGAPINFLWIWILKNSPFIKMGN